MSDDVHTPANPAPLGLVGFGMTTVILSLVNAGALPSGGDNVVIPLAIAFGGSIQLLAGMLEYKNGNTFGTVAFTSYGAFWWWYALLLIFGHTGVVNLQDAGTTIAATLLAWGVFTMYMWVSTFRTTRALQWVFLTLWITFYLLGLGALFDAGVISRIGGWVGLVCGLLACYTSFGLVTNELYGRSVVPLGPYPAR